MTKVEILTWAIETAIENGWDKEATGMPLISHTKGYYLAAGDTEYDIDELYPLIIYNHDFAKALWGDIPYIAYQYHKTLISGLNVPRDDKDLIEQGAYLSWRYHLQQMVISENPIEYLGSHLDD